MTASWWARCRSWFSRVRSWASHGAAGEEIDPDVLDVFLGEIDEVAETLAGLQSGWRDNRNDPVTLQGIRRGFHTLKGSGHMVGARALGDFCGRIEQLALCLIERRSKAAPDTVATIEDAIRILPACSRSIRDNAPLPTKVRDIAQKALLCLGPRHSG